MSFFNKMLASVGIGSAQIDTKLEKDRLKPGEMISGSIEVRGGNVEQNIDSLYLNVYTNFIRETDDRKVTDVANIGHFFISESFTIKPGALKEIPFSFQLPYDTLVTYGKTKIWVATGADIKSSVDPTDKDYIKVDPGNLAAAVINSIYDIGFRLRNVDCEAAPRFLRTSLPIIQEFEFVPYSGPFRGKLDELEMTFFNQSEHQVDILMEVDRKARGLTSLFSEVLEMDESKVRLTVTSNDLANMKNKFQDVISRYTH